MIFADINTFFAEKAGGIRTYHNAKLEWFAGQSAHEYHLVCPGPRHRVRHLAPNVTVIEVYGARLGGGEGGYRLMLDYPRVFSTLRELSPHVVEAGDPWLTGLFCLGAVRSLPAEPVVSAFYHSDPIRTWVDPWARAPRALPRARKVVGRAVAGLFYGLQRRYELTMVSSAGMEEHLRQRGVGRVACVPFGTDPRFAAIARRRTPPPEGTRRLLYAGRLGKEKAADLLLAALPRILQEPGVTVTVLGRGELEDEFASFAHPRYTFRGFVAERDEVARIFGEHDVMLAPGPHETFGLSVLEALAAGLAVVGPDAGGTAERLRTLADPFIFRAGDVDDFVRATRRAVAADAASASRQAARAGAAFHSWDASVRQMVEVYRAVTASRAGAPLAEPVPEPVLTHA